MTSPWPIPADRAEPSGEVFTQCKAARSAVVQSRSPPGRSFSGRHPRSPFSLTIAVRRGPRIRWIRPPGCCRARQTSPCSSCRYARRATRSRKAWCTSGTCVPWRRIPGPIQASCLQTTCSWRVQKVGPTRFNQRFTFRDMTWHSEARQSMVCVAAQQRALRFAGRQPVSTERDRARFRDTSPDRLQRALV